MNVRSISVLFFLTCLLCLNASAQTAGEIVFSTQAIDPAAPAGLTEKFAAGENIHAVAFFDQSLVGSDRQERRQQGHCGDLLVRIETAAIRLPAAQ